MNWLECYRVIALALQGCRQNREYLTDLLADALYANGIGFPISEAGESLDDIDPFTFMASFNRRMPSRSKQRLIKHICSQFDIVCDDEVEFAGAPTLPDYKLRFFSNRQTQTKEIELLWDILDTLLLVDNGTISTKVVCSELKQLAIDFSRINPSGRDRLQWPIYWVCPSVYQLLMESLGQGNYPTTEFTAALESSCDIVLPSADIRAFDRLLEKYVKNNKRPTEKQIEKWHTIARFNSSFDINAPSFSSMLLAALGKENCLLENANTFYPYTEILQLSKLEPERVRDAFRGLFDVGINLATRVLRFCSAVTILHKHYRDHFTRWQAKPCAHASFFVASIYLFMYDPEQYFLYSPARAARLSSAVRYAEIFRPTDADVVESYADMCEQLVDYCSRPSCAQRPFGNESSVHGNALTAVQRQLEAASGITDSKSHILLDDIIIASFDI